MYGLEVHWGIIRSVIIKCYTSDNDMHMYLHQKVFYAQLLMALKCLLYQNHVMLNCTSSNCWTEPGYGCIFLCVITTTPLQAHSLDHEAGSQPDSLHLSDIPSPKGYLPKLRQHLEHHHRHHHKHNRMSAHHDRHDNTPKRHAGVQDGGSSDGDEEGDTTVTDDLTKPHFSKTTKKILAGKQGNEREDIVSSLLSMNRELVELLNRSAHRGAGVGVYPISGDVGMVGYPTPVGRSHTVTPR